MTNEIIVDIQGAQEMAQKLGHSASELDRLLMETIEQFAILEIEKPAALGAQRNFNHPTGNIVSSLHTQVDNPAHLVTVGTNLEYARLREMGGVVSNAWGRGVVAMHTGRPYLVPAFESARSKIENYLDKLISRIIGGMK